MNAVKPRGHTAQRVALMSAVVRHQLRSVAAVRLNQRHSEKPQKEMTLARAPIMPAE